MDKRPDLNSKLDSAAFLDYYYLKDELIEFCRINNLPLSGSKMELTKRIAHFLDTGEIIYTKPIIKTKLKVALITEKTKIESDFVCSQKHREFFKTKIGKNFSFNVLFQKWLKENAGMTYKDAIDAYYAILELKKTKKTTIDRQFEYNTYIRAFFNDNHDKSLKEAIKCWNYKKSLKGHNRYEKSDLIALL